MYVELHMLQNFAPSCLNRDDTNSPKECEFGGYRRGRVSSQCLKRSVREAFRLLKLLPEGNLAVRTKRLVDETARRLAASGKDAAQARGVAEAALAAAGLGVKDGKTQYLLFLGEQEIADFSQACLTHWDALSVAAPAPDETKSAKKQKKAAQQAAPEPVRKAMESLLAGNKAADLALFGRMLADKPDRNTDAACQVAHALSTNKCGVEFDFYTAVDDLKNREVEDEEGAGAGMMGTVEFNSACFYRYANIHLGQLLKNLGGDEALARSTVEAFLRASVAAIPTGKQNSMAAQNPPSYILAVVRDSGLWSLANAYVEPIRPDGKGDLVRKSIVRLEDYWQRLARAYGAGAIKSCCAVCLEDVEAKAIPRVESLDALVSATMGKLSFAS